MRKLKKKMISIKKFANGGKLMGSKGTGGKKKKLY